MIDQKLINDVQWLQDYFTRNGARHDTWTRISDLKRFLEEREGRVKINPHYQNFANFGNFPFSGASENHKPELDRNAD